MNKQHHRNGRINPAPTSMKRTGHRLAASSVLFTLFWQPLLIPEARAAFTPPMIQLFDAPFLSGEQVPPLVMLAVTKDQQLFKKAYDDFSDLNRDGVVNNSDNKLLRSQRGACTDLAFCGGDLNGDGKVNAADRRIMANAQQTCGSSSSAAKDTNKGSDRRNAQRGAKTHM